MYQRGVRGGRTVGVANGTALRVVLGAAVIGVIPVTMLSAAPVGRAGWDVDRIATSGRPDIEATRDRLRATQTMSTPASDRCLDALLAVEQAGLQLRDETDFRCPGSTGFSPTAEQHWGATCWRTRLCPGASYVAVNPGMVGPDNARLRYVVAHEVCHVNSYARTGSAGSEPAADRCAAAAGVPPP